MLRLGRAQATCIFVSQTAHSVVGVGRMCWVGFVSKRNMATHEMGMKQRNGEQIQQREAERAGARRLELLVDGEVAQRLPDAQVSQNLL